ncbi:hypothetical protein HMPREF1141_0638 [Clostridium sp. MSTE9]|nr:hypothetical protein HMPREF1141_0638 [Clostridium sp. MSTE9]
MFLTVNQFISRKPSTEEIGQELLNNKIYHTLQFINIIENEMSLIDKDSGRKAHMNNE